MRASARSRIPEFWECRYLGMLMDLGKLGNVDNIATARVLAAIARTEDLEDLPDYWEKFLAHICDGPEGERLYRGMSGEMLVSLLKTATYSVFNPNNPADNNPDVGTFETELEGELTAVFVRTLPDSTLFQWVEVEGTGKMSVVVKDAIRPKSSTTVVRLAKFQGIEIVSAIKPGGFVFPSTIDKVSGMVHGMDVSKAQVLSAHLEIAGYPRPKR